MRLTTRGLMRTTSRDTSTQNDRAEDTYYGRLRPQTVSPTLTTQCHELAISAQIPIRLLAICSCVYQL